jgi:arsenate reductase
MADMTLYFNPSCSKARGARELLEARDVDFEVIEYLRTPPTRAQLIGIITMLAGEPAELVRKDANFEALGLSADDYVTPDQVADILVAHPELMQRPVAVKDGRAVIGRPSELVVELL